MFFTSKHFFILSFLLLLVSNRLFSQQWTFAKAKDGIKVYTRVENNSSWKSFRGEVTFSAPIEKVCAMLGNDKNIDWWDKAITDVKVLGYEENKFVQYYMIYNVPWPFTNRDIVTETKITDDKATGVWLFTASPLDGKVPENPNLVRIKHYKQTWTVEPMDNGNVHVIIEGEADPGGNIPSWLYNMIIIETPLKMLNSLREKVLSLNHKLAGKDSLPVKL